MQVIFWFWCKDEPVESGDVGIRGGGGGLGKVVLLVLENFKFDNSMGISLHKCWDGCRIKTEDDWLEQACDGFFKIEGNWAVFWISMHWASSSESAIKG